MSRLRLPTPPTRTPSAEPTSRFAPRALAATTPAVEGREAAGATASREALGGEVERASRFGHDFASIPIHRPQPPSVSSPSEGVIQRNGDEETRKEMRRRAAEAAEARMVKQRERGRPRLRQKREQEEAEQESMAKMLLRLKEPQAIYDTLGPEDKWREHIDERHQHHGKNVYVKGFHGRKPDPEYNKRMMEADRYVSSTFGREFDVRDYLELRKRIAKPGEMGAFPRKGELAIRYDKFLDPISTISSEKDPYVKELTEDYEHPETQEHSPAVVLRDVEDPVAEVHGVLGGHYKAIGEAETEEDKLEVIARTHRQLENLHPFVDYNSRTNRLVLNRLLAEQNLPPTILHNPLDVHRMSSAKWIDQIKKGQKLWMKQAERVEEGRMMEGTSAKDEWRKHDRMQELLKKYGQL